MTTDPRPDLTKDAVLTPCPHCGKRPGTKVGPPALARCITVGCPGKDLAAVTIDEWNRRTAAPLLDVTGEEELRAALAEAIEAGSPQIVSDAAYATADRLLPLITARIAQARAEAMERAAKIADNCGPDPMAVFIATAIRNTEKDLPNV